MSPKTQAKALAALDGMREIVRREMVAPGSYVDEEISEPRYAGQLCGGRKFCAIGSLWIGAGVKLEHSLDGWVLLPGTEEDERDDFLRNRHGLRAAYNALNGAAEAWADKHGIELADAIWDAPVEALFERHYAPRTGDLTKRDLLAVIASAKRKIRAAA